MTFQSVDTCIPASGCSLVSFLSDPSSLLPVSLSLFVCPEVSAHPTELLQNAATYQFYPGHVVTLFRLTKVEVPASRSFEALPTSVALLGGLVLGAPPEVERSEHWDIDAKTRKHELHGAEHEGRQRSTRQISEQVNDEDLPESHDANDATSKRSLMAATTIGRDGSNVR